MPRRAARALGLAVLLGAAVLVGLPRLAMACPDCAVGRAARASVWSEGFVRNLLAIALPFALTAAGAVLVGRGGWRGQSETTPRDEATRP